MATYSIPASPAVSSYTTEIFKGVDYTNEESNVSRFQSPNGQNMVRDVVGKVRKSMGWYEYDDLSRLGGGINGRYKLSTDDYELIHVGTKLIRYNPTKNGSAAPSVSTGTDIENGGFHTICSTMNDHTSHAWQMTYTGIASIDGDSDNDGKDNSQVLVIQDGKTLWIYDGKIIYTAASKAYVPTLTIGKSPAGGGYDYEPINLIGGRYKERFIADGTATYHMTLGFDSVYKVEVKNASTGVWSATTAYTTNPSAGTITFNTAPTKVDLNGEDNVRITVNKTFDGYADRINKCTLGIQYGINGVPDRLFVGGNTNADLLNYDWFCGQNDPTYWGDLNYCTVGNNGSSIVGYAIVNNLLAAFKDASDEKHSVVLRTSNLSTAEVGGIDVQDVTFPTYNTLQGDSCVSAESIAYLNNEPLFLTNQGVFALSSNDVSGDRYHQNRSFYINGKLNRVVGKEFGCAVVYNDQYILCVDNQLFILDGQQSLTASGDPYSTRQYACFNRLNVNASVMWVDDERLYFGTSDGKLRAFYNDYESLISYTDGARRKVNGDFPTRNWENTQDITVDYETGFDADGNVIDSTYVGEPIHAIWETNDVIGAKFYKYKKFKYFSLCVKAFARSHVKIEALVHGRWEKVLENDTSANSFRFTSFKFSDLLFSSGIGSTIFFAKYKRKKVDRLRFKIENNEYYQPFGMHNWGCEFVEKGNYKG